MEQNLTDGSFPKDVRGDAPHSPGVVGGVNAYDFDQTIYRGDCTRDFVLWCTRHYPRVLLCVLGQAGALALFAAGRLDKTRFKQRLFSFLRRIPDIDSEISCFWAKKIKKIKPFYLQRKAADDLIVSASPEFLLRPALKLLGVTRIVASQVDKRTGRYTGANCDGAQKPIAMRRAYPEAKIARFFSDSLADAPMAHLADEAYWVKGDRIIPWPNHRRAGRSGGE